MIKFKETKRIKKRKWAEQVQAVAQTIINSALWQIIRQNTEANNEDFDETKTAKLTIPTEDLKSVPRDFSLKVEQNEEGNMVIIASGIENKSDLILPKSEIIK